jgi:hypothetical protein
MAMDSIQPTTERSRMTTAILDQKDELVEKVWTLVVQDRCDSCGSQAYVSVKGLEGSDLMFCSHHYNKIMAIPDGYNSMMSFMISIVDEREKLVKD